jgi:hypothetical protein
MKVIDIDPKKNTDGAKIIEMMSVIISKKMNMEYDIVYKMLNSSVENRLEVLAKNISDNKYNGNISSKLKDMNLEDILDKSIKD